MTNPFIHHIGAPRFELGTSSPPAFLPVEEQTNKVVPQGRGGQQASGTEADHQDRTLVGQSAGTATAVAKKWPHQIPDLTPPSVAPKTNAREERTCRFCSAAFLMAPWKSLTRNGCTDPACIEQAGRRTIAAVARTGTKLPPKNYRGNRNGVGNQNNWRGGRTIDSGGYICVLTGKSTYTQEHRLVMAEMIGRELSPSEVVHHVDRDRTNNHPTNLWLWPDQASHSAWHAIERYGLTLSKPMAAVPV